MQNNKIDDGARVPQLKGRPDGHNHAMNRWINDQTDRFVMRMGQGDVESPEQSCRARDSFMASRSFQIHFHKATKLTLD